MRSNVSKINGFLLAGGLVVIVGGCSSGVVAESPEIKNAAAKGVAAGTAALLAGTGMAIYSANTTED